MSRTNHINTTASEEGIYQLEDYNGNENIYEEIANWERVEISDAIQNDKMCSKKRARMVKAMACVLSLLLLACAGLGVYFLSASYNKHFNNNSTFGNHQNQSLLQNITISLNEISTSEELNDNLQSFIREITLKYSEKENPDQEGKTILYDVKDTAHHTTQKASNTAACSHYIDSANQSNNMQLVKSPSSNENTGLCYAKKNRDKYNIEQVKTLIKYGASVNGKTLTDQNSLLLCARYSKDLNDIEALLVCGADTEARIVKDGKTLLIWASAVNNTDLVRILLKYKAHIDAKDISGQTALIFSSYKGQLEVVDLLLRAGADVNATDNKRRNALFFSTQNRHLHISQLLIQAFSDVNMPDVKRYTPIYNAARTNNIPMARLLLENNADINGFIKKEGHSYIVGTCRTIYLPLNAAAHKSYNKLLEFLIQNGATVNKPGCHNKTALHYAAYKRNLEGVMMLINAGSYVNAVDQYWDTPLHLSVKVIENIQVMEFLLNNNAELNRNAIGYTPLQLAIAHGRNKHVIELLKEYGTKV